MIEHDCLVNLSSLLAQQVVLETEAGKLQRSIAWETMVNRGPRGFTRYGLYFGAIWAGQVKYPEVARLFGSGYLYWRYVDDVADNDRLLPYRYNSRAEYLQTKRTLLARLSDSPAETLYGDREDILLIHYHSWAARLGLDLTKESFDILDTIIFDEERARQRKISTQAELDGHFASLNSAYIKGALKIAKEDCSPVELRPLSMAVSIFYCLRDFPKDFRDGLVNISLEDIERFGVDLTQLGGRSSIRQLVTYDPMRRWYRDQTSAGLRFLNESDDRLGRLKLKPLTNLLLWLRYGWPARRNLNQYARMLTALNERW